jgi:hypothetical protein
MLLGTKSGVALCLTGAQGCGKNVMMEFIGQRIVGEQYYAYVSSLEDLTNKFSSLRCSKCFVICDELDTWKGDHTTANLLKSLITQGKTKLERKGKDPFIIDDYCNFVFLSNFKNFVKVEGKGDRRYCVIAVSSHKTGDTDYFSQLTVDMGNKPKDRKLTDQEKLRAHLVGLHFFHHIMQQDIRNFQPERIPKTDVRVQMESDSTPPLCAFVRWFLDEYLRQCGLPTASDKAANNTVREPILLPVKARKVQASDMYNLYSELMHRAQYEVQFQCVNSFIRRIKQEFTVMSQLMARNKAGSYFVALDAKNMTLVYQQAAEIDTMYRFDVAVLNIRSIKLETLEEATLEEVSTEETPQEGADRRDAAH